LNPNRGIKIGTSKRSDFTLNKSNIDNPGPAEYNNCLRNAFKNDSLEVVNEKVKPIALGDSPSREFIFRSNTSLSPCPGVSIGKDKRDIEYYSVKHYL
jgi:hypothetical protein